MHINITKLFPLNHNNLTEVVCYEYLTREISARKTDEDHDALDYLENVEFLLEPATLAHVSVAQPQLVANNSKI